MIYADYETLNKPLDTSAHSGSTIQTQLLEPCSFAYKVISIYSNFTKETVLYRGYDVPSKLLECLLKEVEDIERKLDTFKPLNLSNEEEVNFQLADTCLFMSYLRVKKRDIMIILQEILLVLPK